MIKLIGILLITNCSLLISQWVTNHNPVAMPNFPKPNVGVTFTDIKFHTYVTRITDARSSEIPGIIPNYSKRQAWNSDESLLMLQTGSSVFRLYNGTTYQFIREIPVEGEDVFWHPTNSTVIIYNPANALYSYNINSNQSTLIRAFNNFLWANTRSEGNLSNDGRYYAFVGRYTDTTFNQIQVYDINTNTIVSSLTLPASLNDFDWVSISPSGNYVVVDYADEVIGRYHGVEVYDRNMNFIWQKPLGAGHSDLGIDANGDEILVMDIYNSDSNKVFLKKFKLASGAETILLSFSQLFYDHISCRNEARREWCFISTFDNPGRLTHDSSSWLPFEDEVFALKLDGSRQVQRIAHHHSRRFSPVTPDPDNSIYWAEPHATISRSGKRMLWGSNWEQHVQSDTSCDTYVCDFTHMIGINKINEVIPERFSLEQNYPNPFNPISKIKFQIAKLSEAKLVVYDILGREIQILVNEKLSPGTYEVEFPARQSLGAGGDGTNYAGGVYFYSLITENFTKTRRMVLIK
jgi:hypothetical protein